MPAAVDLTFRPSLRQLAPQLVLVAAAVAVAAVLRDGALLLVSALGLALVLAMWRRYGTRVTAGGLVYLGLTGDRTIPWAQVQTVDEHAQLGGRGLLVREATGRRTLLRAPRDSRLSPDPDYEAKRDTIVRAWRAGR